MIKICGFFLSPPSVGVMLGAVTCFLLVGLSSQLSAETEKTWKTIIFSDFLTGWARYYDVQTPLRDGGFRPNPIIRTDGYELRKANTPRIGQPYILTLTHRLSNKEFYFDSTPHILMMVPLAVGQTDPSSPASTLSRFGITNQLGKLTSLNHSLTGDQFLRFGLVSAMEQTRFQNLFSAHLRRAWLVGGEVQWGNLSSLSIQIKALTSVMDSFRLDTHQITSTAITTSASSYSSVRLSASRHLVRRLIGELGINHSPSRVTLRDFSDYQNLGLRVHANSSQNRSIELTTTAVTFGMRKVF